MSGKIAFGGIFAGLAVILLYIASIMPTGRLTLYFLSSLPVAFAIVEFGAGAGIAVYIAAGVLSIFVSGNIYAAAAFALFFGHYPIFKYFIEKNRGALVEIMLKLIVFNMSLTLMFILFRSLFFDVFSSSLLNSKVILVVLAVIGQTAFFAYDYVFSRLIFYYKSKVSVFRRE
jgi:hypothetical protein